MTSRFLNPTGLPRSSQGDVDYLGVYCHDLGECYLVPIGDVPTNREAALRVDSPRNRQAVGVRLAATYRI
jgi:hypothetical protein